MDDFPLVPELPRFGSSESYTSGEERSDNSENRLLELFAFPSSSPALQRHMREEEICLVAKSKNGDPSSVPLAWSGCRDRP